jgi:hypothetical protein
MTSFILVLTHFCNAYSLGVSVKMNVLLFFPAFGVLLWKAEGAWLTILNLIVMGGIQVSDQCKIKRSLYTFTHLSYRTTPWLEIDCLAVLTRKFRLVYLQSFRIQPCL